MARWFHFFLATFVLLPSPTVADTILDMRADRDWRGTLALVDHQAALSATVKLYGGVFEPESCNPCAVGAPVGVRAVWAGGDFAGSFTLNGVSYTMGGMGPPDEASGIVFISGPQITAPAWRASPTSVATPFVIDAHISYPDPAAPQTSQLMFSFSAFGVATLLFSPLENGTWAVSRATYERGLTAIGATPTPEPATLFLIGGGLAALIVRQRRRT